MIKDEVEAWLFITDLARYKGVGLGKGTEWYLFNEYLVVGDVEDRHT